MESWGVLFERNGEALSSYLEINLDGVKNSTPYFKVFQGEESGKKQLRITLSGRFSKCRRVIFESGGGSLSDKESWKSVAINPPGIEVQIALRMACNYKCFYCVGHNAKDKPKLHSLERLRSMYESFGGKFTATTFECASGEPTLHPQIKEILEIAAKHGVVNFPTNNSTDPRKWMPAGRPPIHLWAALHPQGEENIRKFIDNLLVARSLGAIPDAVFVCHPTRLAKVQEYTALFKENGIALRLAAFSGFHDGKKYPDSYTTEERALMQLDDMGWRDRIEHDLTIKDYYGIPCLAGSYSLFVDEDGNFRRCLYDSKPLRAFYKKAVPCQVSYCGCGLLLDELNTIRYPNHWNWYLQMAGKELLPIPDISQDKMYLEKKAKYHELMEHYGRTNPRAVLQDANHHTIAEISLEYAKDDDKIVSVIELPRDAAYMRLKFANDTAELIESVKVEQAMQKKQEASLAVPPAQASCGTSTALPDALWEGAAEFVKNYIKKGELVFAPAAFEAGFPGHVIPYGRVEGRAFQWAIIHKGMLNETGAGLLSMIEAAFTPVFANEVFVVFAKRADLPDVRSSEHYKALKGGLKKMSSSLRLKNAIKKVPFLGGFARGVYHGLLRPSDVSVKTPEPARNAAQPVYMGSHRALARTVWGHKMFVDTRDLSLAPHILLDGYWEMWVTKVVMDTVKPGMNVIEVGANFGYYSLLLASAIGEKGKLFSFEANPPVFDILHRNIEVNGFLDRTVVENKAAMDRNTRITFSVSEKHYGSSSIHDLSSDVGDSIRKIEVEAVSLDDYFSDKGLRFDLIRMDAEGSEPFIFDGMNGIIDANPDITIITEFTPSMISGKRDPREFLMKLAEKGFRLAYITTESQIVDGNIDELLSMPSCDLFLKRK